MLQLETKFFNNNSHDTEGTLNRDLNSAQVHKKKQKLNVLLLILKQIPALH